MSKVRQFGQEVEGKTCEWLLCQVLSQWCSKTYCIVTDDLGDYAKWTPIQTQRHMADQHKQPEETFLCLSRQATLFSVCLC